MPVGKRQFEMLAGVAEVKLRAQLPREARRLKCRQDAHFLEDHLIVREQRLADMKTGEVLFLQHEHALAGARKVSGRGAAAGTTAYYQSIIHFTGHAPNEAENAAPSKYRR